MSDLLNSRVQAQSLVDVVAERLEAAVISGELAPGSKISEQALAKSLGVSRGPLREAIRRLEGRKLLQRTPNIGVRVAALSVSDLSDILVVREALEGIACGLAAQRMTDEEIAGLEALLKEHGSRKSIQVGTGYYQESKDFDFHFRIVKGSRNERLIQMLCGDLYDLLRVYRYKSSTLRGRARNAFEEHKEIVAALVKRDPELAEQKMREHIRNARLHVEAQLGASSEANGPSSSAEMPTASKKTARRNSRTTAT
ncbi:GntR family transcriptional regulator [Microvirga sp. KLBC 81]|uniref:GntR family transcriptional regulator n=1 Tax=Microvirga sp. KLBC 81 TaxID=1862707 RepID=UPI000D514E2E|nr:GntR family transcriptional regulator [Microvirga sp. KLBC 81]PVE24899.1 GntR family transcriptional regulator [Microvirga sp. KLBC 81]